MTGQLTNDLAQHILELYNYSTSIEWAYRNFVLLYVFKLWIKRPVVYGRERNLHNVHCCGARVGRDETRLEKVGRQDFGSRNFVISHSFRIPVLRKAGYHTALCNAVISTFLTMNNFAQSHSNRYFSANYRQTTSIK